MRDLMDSPVAEQRLRTMCINWFFLQDPNFLTNLDLQDYKRMRANLYKKIISHPQFETLVRPAYEEFKKTTGDDKDFEKCQAQVFKLMDLINREEKIIEDFE